MNTRKDVNGLFLIIVLIELLAEIFVAFISINGIEIGIVSNLLVSQAIIVLPGLIFFLIKNNNEQVYKPYKKIKFVTVILLLVFTELLMPLVSAANAFSQLFTENEVVNVSGSVLVLPMIVTLFIIGIIGPFCEEFIFRGIIYNGLKGRGERYIASGVLSGLFFGLMHMNLNQFCYAFVLGIIFAIIDEILDSTWPSFICHALINSQNVIMMYMMENVLKNLGGTNVEEVYDRTISAGALNTLIVLVTFIILFVIAVFTTSLAVVLLYGIAAIEGKKDRFKMVFGFGKNKAMIEDGNTTYIQNEDGVEEAYSVDGIYRTEAEKKPDGKTKILYPMGIAAISICVFVMFLLEPILKMLK